MKIKRDALLQGIGFGLVGLAYLISVFFVFNRKNEDNKPGQITIRIAHWQLENGLRQAFDQLAAEFSRQHPGVHVEPLVVPERGYANWLVTQLIGGTAPDIIEMGYGLDDDLTSRYFLPLTSILDQPNPSNNGTSLQGVPWRDTFLEGLNGCFNPNLLDYYSVSLNLHTIRLYYNVALYEKIMGTGTPPPATFAELEAVFAKVADYNKNHEEKIVSIAGSNYNGPIMMDHLMSSQTQKLRLTLDSRLDLVPQKQDVQVGYLLGKWSFRSAEAESGLKLVNELGRNMAQGFLSLRREDATFYFLQGRALMITSGSWDVRTFKSQAPFPIDIIRIPLPAKSDPQYGKFVLGPYAEYNTLGTKLGITRLSHHPKEALEFLQFITSQKGNQLFADTSLWLPSVENVTIPPEIAAFKPVVDGYTSGIAFYEFGFNARLAITQNLYLLHHEGNPAEAIHSFRDAIEPRLPGAIREDLLDDIRKRTHHIERDDTALAALLWKRSENPGSADAVLAKKLAAICLNQTEMEAAIYELKTDLDSVSIHSITH